MDNNIKIKPVIQETTTRNINQSGKIINYSDNHIENPELINYTEFIVYYKEKSH